MLRSYLLGLGMQVVDYYGVAACLCGIVVATGGLKLSTALWCSGILLLGSPVACVFMIWRLSIGRIALQGREDFFN
jgi:hypothetical protein